MADPIGTAHQDKASSSGKDKARQERSLTRRQHRRKARGHRPCQRAETLLTKQRISPKHQRIRSKGRLQISWMRPKMLPLRQPTSSRTP